MREATSPTTPWCQSGWYRHGPHGSASSARSDCCHQPQRFLLHAALDVAAFAVPRVELGGHLARARRILLEQAADAEPDIVEPAGGVDARAHREAEIGTDRACGTAARELQQRAHPGAPASGADALQPLAHEDAVVGIERDHVGHGAQRHQVEQLAEVGLGEPARGKPAVGAQPRAQRAHQVEDHADAGEVLAREVAARLVRVHDGAGRGQRLAGQVMVGDEHVDAVRGRHCHAGVAGDTVVDGDDEIRPRLRGDGDDLGTQPVAVLEAVRHQEVRAGAAHRAQREQAERGAGRAVGVVVTDDQDALVARERASETRGGRVQPEQRGRQQLRQPLLQLARIRHAARGVEPRQQRTDAGGNAAPARAVRRRMARLTPSCRG